MTGAEVLQIIHQEIGHSQLIPRWHGVDLGRCLLSEPVRTLYSDCGHPNPVPSQTIELWLVLEENPDTKAGYKIVFDELSGEFGLAVGMAGENLPVYLGAYGTFLNAFEAM